MNSMRSNLTIINMNADIDIHMYIVGSMACVLKCGKDH